MLKIESPAPGHIKLQGRLDATQAAAAQAFLDEHNGVLTLECSGLEYIASAGLGVLLKTQKRLKPAGGRLRLVGLSPHVRNIFVYAGFDKLFEIVASGA